VLHVFVDAGADNGILDHGFGLLWATT
jgi:hypothetical protein